MMLQKKTSTPMIGFFFYTAMIQSVMAFICSSNFQIVSQVGRQNFHSCGAARMHF